MDPNLIALNQLESTVTLYPADSSGAPILTSPIWTGVTVENLTIRERWLKGETRPTGAPYPKRHPLIQQYELSLGRVWSLQVPTTDGGFIPQANYYVLDIVWQDGDTNDWHRETFYNVSISERSRTSRDIESGFTDEVAFDAEYMAAPSGGATTDPSGGAGPITAPSGGNGTVPPISAGVPMTVLWVGADGRVPLYNYASDTHAFTEVSAGISTSRATLAYSGSGGAAVFNVTFSGAGGPALQVEADGGLLVTALKTGSPDLSNVPRVEFYYGTQRVAALTSSGILFAASFSNGSLATGTGKFALYGGGTLAVTLAASGVISAEYEED